MANYKPLVFDSSRGMPQQLSDGDGIVFSGPLQISGGAAFNGASVPAQPPAAGGDWGQSLGDLITALVTTGLLRDQRAADWAAPLQAAVALSGIGPYQSGRVVVGSVNGWTPLDQPAAADGVLQALVARSGALETVAGGGQVAGLGYAPVVSYGASEPAAALKGTLWFDTGIGVLKIRGESSWVDARSSFPDATTSAKGVVQLADGTALSNGTAGRVVDAAQLKAGLELKADLASPALTGVPTAPTAAAGNKTTQIATTAFVADAVAAEDLWNRAGTELTPKNSGDSIRLTPGGTPPTGAGIYSSGPEQLAISTGGYGRLFVDASGNIGINTSPSSLGSSVTTLEIKGGSTTRSGGLRVSSSDSSVKGAFYIYDGAGVLGTESATPLDLYTGNSPRLRITSAGLVGVGTSTPGSFAANALVVERGTTAGITISESTGAGTAVLAFAATSAFDNKARIFSEVGNANLKFATAGTTAVTIDSSGRLGVGTASPTSLLHLSASALADLRFTDAGEATDQKNWAWQTGTGIGTGTFRLRAINDANSTGENAYIVTRSGASVQTHQWLTAGSERLRIDSSGRVGIGTSSPGSLLDLVGGDIRLNSVYGINKSNEDGYIHLSGGTSNSLGGTIFCFGQSHISNANEIHFRNSGNQTRVVIDSSGRVGIGTTSPGAALSIGDTSTTASNQIRLHGPASGTAGGSSINVVNGINTVFAAGNASNIIGGSYSSDAMLFWGNADLRFYGNSSERARIDSSGRLGLGTSLPTQSLSIGGSGATLAGTAAISLFDGNSGASRRWSISNGAGGNAIDLLGKLVIGYSSTVSSDPMTGTAAVVIDSSGRVGIGTNPLAKFHVNLGTNENIHFATAGSGDQRIQALNDAGGTSVQLSVQASPLLFRGAGGAEVGRWDSSGRLLVGASSSTDSTAMVLAGYNGGGANLPAVLWMKRTENASTITADESLGLIRFGSLDSGFGASIDTYADGTWSSTSDCPTRLVFSTTPSGAAAPVERMRISQSGTVTIYGPRGGTFLNLSNSGGYSGLHEVDNTAYTIGQNSDLRAMRIGSGANWLTTGVSLAAGGTSWSTYSDERLKTDIVELAGCLDGIKAIRCVSYRLTDVDDASSKKRIGVIAQDLVGKYDEAITTSRRSEGDETEYLSVQYSDLIPVLLKALQEASVKIETLEAKVAALESA